MRKVYTYAHTHWDYEWYFSYNESNVQFVYHMDDVLTNLKNGNLKTYVLDGQMSILEEYLRICPSKTKEVNELVADGKLIIGPWYTQTDEMIIRGESIIRNLYYGIKMAESFGPVMRIGYLPDSFGQSQNMPKIYNGFDINQSIFWRGVDDRKIKKREFNWTAGSSEVTVYNIKNGYFFGGEVWMEKENVDKTESQFLKKTTENIILLPVGSDQRKVDKDYLDTINFYNKNTENDLQYVDSTPNHFMDLLQKRKESLEVVSGEFLEAQDSKIHRSIYSSRYDHKYLNDKIERRIVNQLEPVMAYANELGFDSKLDLLEEIWKVLLKNHAHDSACGCNTDKTNSVILNRLKQADELSYSTTDYILRMISESNPKVIENDIVMFPANFHSYLDCITINVSTKAPGFKLYLGNIELEYDMIEQERIYGGSICKEEKNQDQDLYYYVSKIVFRLNLEPMTPLIINLVEQELECLPIKQQIGKMIEDDYYKISIESEQLQLTVKQENLIINDWLKIVDDGDDGDTYDFSPMIEDTPLELKFNKSKTTVTATNGYKEMCIDGYWEVPRNEDDRKENLNNQIVDYKLYISLKNNNRIDCKLYIENKQYSHRMRAIFNTNINSTSNFSATPMGQITRKNESDIIDSWRELSYKEEPTSIYPMIDYCGLKNDKNECLIMSKGIKEFQILDDTRIALTLFRSVGYLGKPDLLRRPGTASGNQYKYVKTEDSQLIKPLKFKFSYSFGTVTEEKERVQKTNEYANTPLVYQKQSLNLFTNTLKYFKINTMNKEITFNKIFENINLTKAYISAITPLENNYILIRIINPTSDVIEETLKINSSVKYSVTNMLGEEDKKYVCAEDGCIKINEINPGGIVNIKLKVLKENNV